MWGFLLGVLSFVAQSKLQPGKIPSTECSPLPQEIGLLQEQLFLGLDPPSLRAWLGAFIIVGSYENCLLHQTLLFTQHPLGTRLFLPPEPEIQGQRIEAGLVGVRGVKLRP